jgi:hypothetical protein
MFFRRALGASTAAGGRMAFDEQLAERICKGLAGHQAVEKRMFGGLCFMVKGAMCCGVYKDDSIARVGSERHDER